MALSQIDRLKLIESLAEHFSDKSYVLIDTALEAFGLAGLSSWDGDKFEYTVFVLKSAPDHALLGLAEYAGLPGPEGQPLAVPPKQSRKFKPFRLFISHIAKHKVIASDLSTELAKYGIDGFVAHEDIAPAAEWLVEVERRLGLCDALVALLHKDFKESDWTDQEVGWVVGRKKPVISVKYDLPPYGFFGKTQAFSGAGKSAVQLAREIFRRLADHPSSRKSISHALVGKFYKSGSFVQAKQLAELLPLLKYWDDELRAKVEAAESDNSQVSSSFGVPAKIAALKTKWGAPGSVT